MSTAEVLRANVIISNGPGSNPEWELSNVQMREIGNSELLIELVATGICHSDIAYSQRPVGAPFPKVLGHEG